MDIVLVLLRLLHIVAGAAWVGIAAVFTFFILPTSLASGESGARFLKTLLTKTPILILFPIAAGLTMGAGLLLYGVSKPWTHLADLGNLVLGVGATFGMVAGFHFRFGMGNSGGKLIDLLKNRVSDDGQPVAADILAVIRSLGTKLISNSRVNFVFIVIALIGMGSARYL
jgi:uncharacterized protein involved in response to NO